MKVRYEAIWWSDILGTTNSMRFDNQTEAYKLAKELAKTTITYLRKLTWTAAGAIESQQVKINKDGTWE